ncbi:SR-rich pre-mRNA splicing activator [Coprinopsis cinerea okayama7|uniref:SR-rich pre-mRNA splicing activator n=1 Tax=Coprinopsis cinerea (strain Okayama-7 / 130 / ATCC MYA-4618 / FGSC 9003) TaxID=240176 RepID=A8NCG6_COPC7|nr:SR-rich pre-mRNA splicing activator [Coprinopsis cinerea okayama7\|eukprot:XP_001832510.2 SR-rich pre-mRNA splicing activator [Coprinopsis cinerea okayama7\
MADAGFFKGTSAEQDRRFADKEAKLMKTMKFPAEFEKRVDMRKVNLTVIRPWVAKKIIELIGFEDEVVVEYAMGLLEDDSNPTPDPRKMQISLQGFLTNKTASFMTELWKLLIEAQEEVTGVPRTFVEQKKEELRRARENDARAIDERDRRMRLDEMRGPPGGGRGEAEEAEDAGEAGLMTVEDGLETLVGEAEAEVTAEVPPGAARPRPDAGRARGPRLATILILHPRIDATDHLLHAAGRLPELRQCADGIRPADRARPDAQLLPPLHALAPELLRKRDVSGLHPTRRLEIELAVGARGSGTAAALLRDAVVSHLAPVPVLLDPGLVLTPGPLLIRAQSRWTGRLLLDLAAQEGVGVRRRGGRSPSRSRSRTPPRRRSPSSDDERDRERGRGYSRSPDRGSYASSRSRSRSRSPPPPRRGDRDRHGRDRETDRYREGDDGRRGGRMDIDRDRDHERDLPPVQELKIKGQAQLQKKSRWENEPEEDRRGAPRDRDRDRDDYGARGSASGGSVSGGDADGMEVDDDEAARRRELQKRENELKEKALRNKVIRTRKTS